MKNHITVRERGARQWGTSTNKEKNIRKFEEEEEEENCVNHGLMLSLYLRSNHLLLKQQGKKWDCNFRNLYLISARNWDEVENKGLIELKKEGGRGR